jgi:ribosomal protein S18 acetylase RimI-like enzyme
MDLLLLADPHVAAIAKYISDSEVLLAESDGVTVGVCAVMPIGNGAAEIKNVAVHEDFQGKGIGKNLIQHAITHSRRRGFRTLEIGTGNAGLMQLGLYQRLGFEMVSIDRDFFVRNYPEPIFENGIACKHMVRLELKL